MKTAQTAKDSSTPSVSRKDNGAPFFSPVTIQPKLTINQPNDIYEQEADANSEKVMLMRNEPQANSFFFKPAPPPLQRKCTHCEEEEELHRKESNEEEALAGKSTENYLHTLSGGTPLGDSDRSFFESRMGQDFSGVRVHTDNNASESAKDINARAYTRSSDIVFGSGEYQPGTDGGKKLLAHELTHVVQQSKATSNTTVQRELVRGADLGEGNRSFVSNATTVQGAFSDVSQYLSARNLAGNYAHVFVITASGLIVFETTSGRQLHFYSGRPTERLMPLGLWIMSGSGGLERLYVDSSGRILPAESWTFENLDGFSPERQQIIQQRGSIMLEDFVDLTVADLQSNHFLPAAVISTSIQAGTGTGVADQTTPSRPTQAPWAAGQVAAVQQRLQQSQSGSTGSTSEGGQPSHPASSTPDRLVGWVREDGGQFVNVWVGGANIRQGGVSEAVELHEGETTEQLQQRIEGATTRARERLTQQAITQENQVTGGNLPYNDSTYLGGEDHDGPRPNQPAYRANITGPDTMVRDATGNYSMHLHYEDVTSSLLGQVLEAYTGANYTWQIIDITTLYDQVKSQRDAQLQQQQQQLSQGLTPTPQRPTEADTQLDNMAHRDHLSDHETVGRTAAVGRDFTRTAGNVAEDARTAAHDLAHPLSSQDGSEEAAMRAVVVNEFNLETLPLHAIMSLGGWLIRSFAAIFRPHDDDDRDVPFPDHDGVFLIRCVAQPRIHGDADGQYALRMPSVAVKTVQVKNIKDQVRQELDAQDQNLQASIFELLTAYRTTTDQTQLQNVRRLLELKVQEAAQTNRSFLQERIREREQLLNPDSTATQTGTIPDDVRQKITEELEILRGGTQSQSGTLAMIFTRQITLKEQELEEARRSRPLDVSRLERELDMLRSRLSTATAREREMIESGTALIRPTAVFVNEADGQTIPLLIEIGQMGQRHTTRGYTMRVSDITANDGDEHDAIGSTRAAAVTHALQEYANHFPYGRGYMNVRMPAENNFGITEPLQFRCNPHDTQQASERLDELLQLLAVLGLFVPGVGTVALVVGAAVSAERLLHRVNNHTFEWDMSAVMDVLNILSAVASGVSHLANTRLIRAQRMFAIVEGPEAEMPAWIRRLEMAATVADMAEHGVNNLSYFLGTMETVQNYLEIQRKEIRGEITHSDARRQRAQLIAQGMFDQFMQHAPTVIEGVREQREANGQHSPTPPPDEQRRHTGDEERTTRPPQDEAARRRLPDDPAHTGEPPAIPVPERDATPHHAPPETHQPVPLTPAQRVAAFFGNRDNVRGILSGDMSTTLRLMQEHGNWRDLIMHLQSEPHNDLYGVAIENLENLRRGVVAMLSEHYGLHLSDPNASTLASSDIDLATTGTDAGARMTQAEEFMRARYGEHWSENFRMNFYTAAERLFIYEQVRHLMTDADFGALQQQVTTLAETLNFAKMMQHAEGNADSVARVEALMAYLTEPQRAEVRRRAAETTADSQRIVAELHVQIDTLVGQFEALPANDPRRVELAREITRMQMEANFRTQEAYVSPGAGRHVVRGVAVHGYEAYQSALSQLEMMEHIMHTTGGNVETAIREYELYKYIARFIEAMTTAGLPVDASMLAYYQASFDVYRNSRTQLQGVGRHDLVWLTGMHDHFMQTAAEVLPRLQQNGAGNPADWNPEHRSMQTPSETRTVPDETGEGTRQIRVPLGIGDSTIPLAQAEEGTITDADVERSLNLTFGLSPQTPGGGSSGGTGGTPPPTTPPPSGRGERPTLPPPATAPATPVASERTDRSTAGERYFVTDSASPRLSVMAYIERGLLRIDMRTVLPDGTRSSVLNGSQEFARIMQFFAGQFTGILANWQYGTNLGRVNELTGNGMPIDQAVRQTWTGQRAAENGFTQVRITEQSGSPGSYSTVKVLFARP